MKKFDAEDLPKFKSEDLLKELKKSWEQPTYYRDIPDYKKVKALSDYSFKGIEQVKSYTGAFEQGKPCGTGTMEYTNGSTFHGEFFGGVKHGRGTLIKADGTTVEGFWKNGKFICSCDD